MKKILLPVLILFLAACSHAATKTDITEDAMMEGMPCHQMANGMWMGDCDK